MVRALLVGLSFSLAAATAVAAESSGRVVISQGAVTVVGAGGLKSDLRTGDTFAEGDTVEVGSGSFTRLMMQDGSVLDLGANTRVVFRSYSVDRARAKRKASMKVWLGRVWARVAKALGSDDSYTVTSENAVAGVRGTEFLFEVDAAGQTTLSVLDGSVAFTSKLTHLSETFGAMTRGAMDGAGQISRSGLSAADVKALTEGARIKPKLDSGRAAGRLQAVRERLGLEVTPADEPVELLVEEADEEEDEDPLEGLEEDPSDPFLDLDPDTGSTRVRGTVEVVEP